MGRVGHTSAKQIKSGLRRTFEIAHYGKTHIVLDQVRRLACYSFTPTRVISASTSSFGRFQFFRGESVAEVRYLTPSCESCLRDASHSVDAFDMSF